VFPCLPGSAEAFVIGEMGKQVTFCLLTFSVTFLPKIIKIGWCDHLWCDYVEVTRKLL